MIGSHVDAVMADAIDKGIKGFDYETAYAGIRKNAFGDAEGKNDGRPASTTPTTTGASRKPPKSSARPRTTTS